MQQFVSNIFSAAMLASVLSSAALAADDYPSRPIRPIIPFPPGGSNDIIGRMLGLKLGESLGKPVVIDNRSGAGGNLGIDIAAKSAADGYTMLMVSAAFAFGPSMYQKLPYDSVKSFVPVAKIGYGPNAMPELPTIDEAGLPGYEAANWWGIMFPARTPAAIVTRLDREIAAILALEEIKKRFATDGAEPDHLSQGEFAKFVATETAKWGRVVKAAGIKPE